MAIVVTHNGTDQLFQGGSGGRGYKKADSKSMNAIVIGGLYCPNSIKCLLPHKPLLFEFRKISRPFILLNFVGLCWYWP